MMKVRAVYDFVGFGKKQKKVSEKDAQKSHFKARFLERVGYILTDSRYEELKNLTHTKGKYLHPGEKGTVYFVNFRGLHLKVVYNIFTRNLITILPQ
jgi:hypothetical protein